MKWLGRWGSVIAGYNGNNTMETIHTGIKVDYEVVCSLFYDCSVSMTSATLVGLNVN